MPNVTLGTLLNEAEQDLNPGPLALKAMLHSLPCTVVTLMHKWPAKT